MVKIRTVIILSHPFCSLQMPSSMPLLFILIFVLIFKFLNCNAFFYFSPSSKIESSLHQYAFSWGKQEEEEEEASVHCSAPGWKQDPSSISGLKRPNSSQSAHPLPLCVHLCVRFALLQNWFKDAYNPLTNPYNDLTPIFGGPGIWKTYSLVRCLNQSNQKGGLYQLNKKVSTDGPLWLAGAWTEF